MRESRDKSSADCAATGPLHNVLVEVRLAVVGGCEGAEPGHGEGMAEHHLHVHPLGLLGPAPLFLLQLLDALRGAGGTSRLRGDFGSVFRTHWQGSAQRALWPNIRK